MPKRDIKRCPDCGVSFIKQTKDQYYCSDSCELPHRKRSLVKKKKCRRCAKDFETRVMNQVYCTKSCASIDYAERQRLARALEREEINKQKAIINPLKKKTREPVWLKSAQEWLKRWRESKKKC